MEPLDPEILEFMIQFLHPAKNFPDLPGIDEELVATMFGVDSKTYRDAKDTLAARAEGAADELLADPAMAKLVNDLPFESGQTVAALGDSITDDLQSWAEILKHLLAKARPEDGITVINAGISGDTTSQMISRFLGVVLESPDWIICMAGTNDARRHGEAPTKILVSIEETEKNLLMLRNFAATQSSAKWVWMTPGRVLEKHIAAHPFLAPRQLMWLNEDLDAIADLVRSQPDPVVDLQPLFGDPDLLLPDGLHPSIAGQKVIVRALLEKLSTL